MFYEGKRFDITKNRPDVLLLGNGILLSSAAPKQEGKNWEESVFKLSESLISVEQQATFKGIPYSVLASIVASTDDKGRRNAYLSCFQTLKLNPNSLLHQILKFPFDAVLTTNYTYEIEDVFYPRYSSLSNKLKYAHTHSTRADTRYAMHTFNQFKNSPEIWHVHGELRNKSSIVLTHDEYGRLSERIIERNRHIGNRYEFSKDNLPFTSWMDYFLVGNLHIVGLGMDFSEFDLWWLLNRRKREKISFGNIYFYASKDNSPALLHALDKLGVNVVDANIDETKPKDIYYGELYRYIISYIQNEINKSEGERQ